MQFEILKIGEKVYREIKRGKQIFSTNLVKKLEKPPGTLVKIMYGNKFVAWGVINPWNSYRYLRILSYDENFDFIEDINRKLKRAEKYRKKIGYKNHYRLVYSESDFLSGLIIDRYNNIFVIQNYNYYYDINMKEIVNTLIELYGENISIIEKSIGKWRENEGMIPKEVIHHGNEFKTIIREAKKKFIVDTLLGQKTGWFLDQRENRKIIRKIQGDKVLDVFSYTGSFGIIINASNRYFVEKDEKAIKILRENLRLNNIAEDNYKIYKGNAFEVLRDLYNKKEKFDVIILDPPDLLAEGHLKGIKSFNIINSIAIDLIDEGFLITFSCSQDLKEDKMLSILRTLIRRKGKRFEIIARMHQALDHKVIFPHKELKYLKGYIIEILP